MRIPSVIISNLCPRNHTFMNPILSHLCNELTLTVQLTTPPTNPPSSHNEPPGDHLVDPRPHPFLPLPINIVPRLANKSISCYRATLAALITQLHDVWLPSTANIQRLTTKRPALKRQDHTPWSVCFTSSNASCRNPRFQACYASREGDEQKHDNLGIGTCKHHTRGYRISFHGPVF